MDIAAESAYSTPVANSPLLPLLLLSLATQRNAPLVSTTFQKEYDYIVVGAGSAGSVVASRLSEIPCVSVLLLEAGKPPPLLDDIPGYSRNFWFSDLDWAYQTVPQKYTGRGLVNRQIIWPSGKGLGGSSLLNAMWYVRGNRKNYDDWADQGAKGWSTKDVYPYFLKLEDNTDIEYLEDGYHSVRGPVTVHRPEYIAEMKPPLIEAVQELGYKFVDPNGRRQTGFYDQQATIRYGQRCSTAKAYLVPAENRTNLDILPYAHVRKVVIRDGRATGVIFDYSNATQEVSARREVIMSAGTTNTAQLLMLSGIGPRQHLDEFNIPVVADLPVGNNLQDDCGTLVNFLLDPQIPQISDKLSNTKNIEQYIYNRTGPLTATEAVSVMAFLLGSFVNPIVDFPNYELYFAELTTESVRTQFGLTQKVFDQVYGPYVNQSFYACVVHALQPKSRGTVRLQSTNPYDPPLIDPNYFSDPRDMHDMVQGMKTCQKIGTSKEMKRVGSWPFTTLYPGCEELASNEDLYLECQLRSAVFTFHNQVGTAKMGDPKDASIVVDPSLRVIGIEGLRVVDASIMPIIPSGNPNVPTIMIAEKASDIIKSTITCDAQMPE